MRLGLFSLLTTDALLILNHLIAILMIITCVLRYGFGSVSHQLSGINSISLGSSLLTLLVFPALVFSQNLFHPVL